MSTLIDRSISFDADSHTQGGTKEFIYLVNHSDLLDYCTLTEDGTTHEIEDITMSGGKLWYKYTLPKGANIIAPVSQRDDGYVHTVQTIIKTLTQLDIENIMRMKFNKVAIIVPLIEGRALLYGKNVGLLKTTTNINPGDAAVGGAIDCTFSTPDGPPENEVPHLIEAAFDLEGLLT